MTSTSGNCMNRRVRLLGLSATCIAAFILFNPARTWAGRNQQWSDEIVVGDTAEKVLQVLGKPLGRVVKGNFEIWSYNRGLVSLTDKKVVSAKILTEQQQRLKRERELREEAAARAAAEEARTRRIAEGTVEKSSKLGNPAFQNLSAPQKLAYWREFKRKYPEVSVDAEIVALQNDLSGMNADASAASAAELDKKIRTTEEEIEILRNSRGLSRSAFKEARQRLAQLQVELEELRKQKSALQ